MRMADRYLINKCLDGDSTAFGLLVDRYKESIYALAYAKLRNFHDAEDVTQETFIKAYQNLRKLRQWDDFHAWIYAIASNLCKDWIRAKSRQPDRDFIEDQSAKSLDNYSSQENSAIIMLHDALDSLPETYQQVLTLHYLGGMDGAEIAEFLGTSPTSIWQRLSRARSLLRKEMLDMMSETFEQQRLRAGFTFRIVEKIKDIKLNPMSPKTLPWGLSLATGIIIAVLNIGSNLDIINQTGIISGSQLQGESKVLKAGEIPVDVMKVSKIEVLSNQNLKGTGLGSLVPSLQNALFMAPKAEGGTWEKKKDMPNATTLAASAEIDGKIYIIGGFPNGTDNQMYDPKTDSWTKKANLPVGTARHTSAVCNGKIYIIGGTNNIQDLFPTISTVWEYDPKNDNWQQKKDMPFPKCYHSAVEYNNKIYVFGGEIINANGGIASHTVFVYDPDIDQWDQLKDIPPEFHMDGSVAINYKDKIYFLGGINDNGWVLLSHVSIFDPLKENWRWSKEMISTPRINPGAGIINNRVYVIGGINIGFKTVYAEVEEYNIDLDKWITKTNMPSKRAFLGTSQLPVVDGKIYVIGGDSNFMVPLSNNEVYTPDIENQKMVSPLGKLLTQWGDLRTASSK